MPETIRVAVVDDHPLVRQGIEFVLTPEEGIEVVAQGSTMEDAIAIIKSGKVDIMLLDVNIPGGGLNALKAMSATRASTKIAMLTVSDTGTDVMEALSLGASGYILKGIRGNELIDALRTIFDTGTYMSPQLGMKVLAEMNNSKKAKSEDDTLALAAAKKTCCPRSGLAAATRK